MTDTPNATDELRSAIGNAIDAFHANGLHSEKITAIVKAVAPFTLPISQGSTASGEVSTGASLADMIEAELVRWKGANGGIYAIRAAACNVEMLLAAPSPTPVGDLVEALEGLRRVFLPVDMQLAQAEIADETVPDEAVLFSFMGSGASDHVTVGEYRRAAEFARTALSKAHGHHGEGK